MIRTCSKLLSRLDVNNKTSQNPSYDILKAVRILVSLFNSINDIRNKNDGIESESISIPDIKFYKSNQRRKRKRKKGLMIMMIQKLI